MNKEKINKAIEQLEILHDLTATGLDATSANALQLGIESLKLQVIEPVKVSREKIAKWLFKDYLHPTSQIYWETKWAELTERDRAYYRNKADQIIALIKELNQDKEFIEV